MTDFTSKTLIADDWRDYELLDSGNLQKLERFGSQRIIRPDPQAYWSPSQPVENWNADARFSSKTGDDDRGHWDVLSPAAQDEWPMRWNELTFKARRTPFRHLGVFQEHSVHWQFAQEQIRRAKQPIKVLNAFGYTGLMSIACASAGAEVVHLDASPKSNGYGKENQSLSGLQDRTIRWITDDAMKFLAREVRRGNTYQGIVLDPPKFGRGPKNETWRFEQDFPEMLAMVKELLAEDAVFVILTTYAMRLSHYAIGQSLYDIVRPHGGALESGEMALQQVSAERVLPTALYARWSN